MKNNIKKSIVKGSNVVNFIIPYSLFPIGSIVLIKIFVGSITPPFWLFFIILECLFLIFVLNFYYFHEEYIEIYSPMRIGKKRGRKIHYSEIVRVKYVDRPLNENSYIRIYVIGKKHKFPTFSNTFSSISLKNTRQILIFLESKGIPIEIEGASNRRKQKILGLDHSI